MAGRGCTITVQYLSPSENSDISLPVALHTPLLLFKQQIGSITGIDTQDQVLILLNLLDPDRNSDVHLNADYDNISLRDCRVRNGSVFSLHALGVSAEKRSTMLKQAAEQKQKDEAELADRVRGTRSMHTPITAENSDHSYNGIIFDLTAQGAYEVEVCSVSIAGMLGRIRVFARCGSWKDGLPGNTPAHPWGRHVGVTRDGWVLVADQRCRPSWDRPVEIFLEKPFHLSPHQSCALYVHSNMPDDLGIQYSSCNPKVVVCESEALAIYPGLGHCSSRPFDNEEGWYREGRVLAGSIRYRARLKGWHKRQHHIFPPVLREAVRTMLACYYSSTNAHSPLSSSSPRYLPRSQKVAWETGVRNSSAGGAGGAAAATTTEEDTTMAMKESRLPAEKSRKKKVAKLKHHRHHRRPRSPSEEEAFLMERADSGRDAAMSALFGFSSDAEDSYGSTGERGVSSGGEDSDVELDARRAGAGAVAGAGAGAGAGAIDSPASRMGTLSLSLPSAAEQNGESGPSLVIDESQPYVRPAMGRLDEKYLIYYIMEFCNFDWFKEVEEARLEKARAERRERVRLSRAEAAEGRQGSTRSGGRGGAGAGAEDGEDDDDIHTDQSRSRLAVMREAVRQMLSSYGMADVTEDAITTFMTMARQGEADDDIMQEDEDNEEEEDDDEDYMEGGEDDDDDDDEYGEGTADEMSEEEGGDD